MNDRLCKAAGIAAFFLGIPALIAVTLGACFLGARILDWLGKFVPDGAHWPRAVFFIVMGAGYLFFSAMTGMEVYDKCRKRPPSTVAGNAE